MFLMPGKSSEEFYYSHRIMFQSFKYRIILDNIIKKVQQRGQKGRKRAVKKNLYSIRKNLNHTKKAKSDESFLTLGENPDKAT